MKVRAAGAAWLALTLAPGAAGAHPIDEVVQGAYLTLAPGEVRLELDLTPGAQVAGIVLRDLDADRDRRITEAEALAYARGVMARSTLTVDGKAAAWTIGRVAVPPYANLLGESDTIKVYATARRAERAGAHTLTYENRYEPAKSQCVANIFLRPGAGWAYRVTGQQRSNDGRRLTVSYAAARP